MKSIILHITFAFAILAHVTYGQQPSDLILKAAQLKMIKKNLGKVPVFDQSLNKIRIELDAEIRKGSEVPIPKDMAGGYTHEVHRRNYQLMEQAGYLYRIVGDHKYLDYIKGLLNKYAAIYKGLPLHPAGQSYARGKLFWQCLNDANWLVSVSQAYASIYTSLTKSERNYYEQELFRPYADFLSVQNPQFFNRIHNHSTWGCAAVGMIGLVMQDDELVERALYGLKSPGIRDDQHDNDGALILMPGQNKAGYFAQIDGLFSPDGLYAEGPYYHRYALYPFLIFAVSLENLRPDIQIFKYSDSVLIKSVFTLLAQSNLKGEFFPINDAQKGMSVFNSSLVAAVDIAYFFGGKDRGLLSIAKAQGEVLPDASGMAVAMDIHKSTAMIRKSQFFRDGATGDGGGIGILRTNNGAELLFKFGTQGMGHGHFDRLSYLFDEQGEEVIQDYGMARFVNIEQKGGGGYLKENTSFAKQSIAHNTLVVNQTSHFNGNVDLAEMHAPALNFLDIGRKEIQVISAHESSAYKDISFSRTLTLLDESVLGNTMLLDVLKINSTERNQYDLPLYYQGQWLDADFKYNTAPSLMPLGTSNGYQHIWRAASGLSDTDCIHLSWLGAGKFYSYTGTVQQKDSLIMGFTGATDPSFNLRRDPLFLIRRNNQSNTVFASILESHGSYSPIDEKARSPYGIIDKLQILQADDEYTVMLIELKDGSQSILALANKFFSNDQSHHLEISKHQLDWKGPYFFDKLKQQ